MAKLISDETQFRAKKITREINTFYNDQLTKKT